MAFFGRRVIPIFFFLFLGAIAVSFLVKKPTGPVVDFANSLNQEAGVSQQDSTSPSGMKTSMIDWRLLRELDYKTGRAGEKLKAMDGKRVRIPGFMVPLEDDLERVNEFLFVPDGQACIHVPPPPPNQMIFVKMKGDQRVKVLFEPLWLEGMLYLQKIDSPYGAVSFLIEGESLKIFSWPGGAQ